MTTEEQIEEILIEAASCCLRIEVIETAQEYIQTGLDKLTAYEYAFNEWIE